MAATTVLRWFHRRSDPPVVQRVIVEAEEQLALRNQQKLKEAKQALGGHYVLHASNKVIRKREERPRALPALQTDSARTSKKVSSNEGNAKAIGVQSEKRCGEANQIVKATADRG